MRLSEGERGRRNESIVAERKEFNASRDELSIKFKLKQSWLNHILKENGMSNRAQAHLRDKQLLKEAKKTPARMLAKKYDLTTARVWQICKEAKVVPAKDYVKHRKADPEEVGKFLVKTKSAAETAAKFGISRQRVYQIAEETGLNIYKILNKITFKDKILPKIKIDKHNKNL